MSDRGVRIGQEMLTFVGKKERIRPLRDVIVVEPLPAHETLIIDTWKPIRGKVLAVGPGTFPKRYNGPKGKRTKSWDSKAFRPCDVKIGDEVELGGRELGGYLHQTVRWGSKEVVVCREEDVALVRE
jgi:co-chaperonin GroES (HSP10)